MLSHLSRSLRTLVLLGFAPASIAAADAPSVVTDIAPVHSLVARVMQGVGHPKLIVEPGTSPHDFAMRPSQAQALNDAQLVIWIGPELTPWLSSPMETLAADATHLELLDTEGTYLMNFRDMVLFNEAGHSADHDGDHDGDHTGDHGDDHSDDHDETHDNDHAEKHTGDHDGDHTEGHAGDHAGHDHTGVDPHAWLSPDNAIVWINAISSELSRIDPENSARYQSNAQAGAEEIRSVATQARDLLDPHKDRRVMVFHDAYQYFDRYFELNVVGAVTLGDASDPGAARIATLRDAMEDQHIHCVFSEPQFNPNLIDAISEGVDVGVAVLDPLGADLEPGPQMYTGLLGAMAAAIAGC